MTANVVRTAIVRMLAQDPELELVGEAGTFAETLRLTTALKPDILVLDLHMPDEPEYSPQIVKSQVLYNIDCILAISIVLVIQIKQVKQSAQHGIG